jgi:translation initiation factor IF-2
MVEETTMRLSQVARKLNIGTTTIATHLAEKGFRVENKPNAKITLEQYKILAKEFGDASMDKEAAELFISKAYNKEAEKVLIQEKVLAEPIAPMPIPEPEPKELQEIPEDKEVKALVPELSVSIVPESIIEQPIIIEGPAQPIEQPIKEEVKVISIPSLAVSVPEKVFMEEKKLKGLTILGKMDLTEKEGKKFQQVASSDIGQESKKRPRKRIAKKPVSAVKEPSKAAVKPATKAVTKAVKQEKATLSEKEIQEQIKNTLAKLGSASKSTNRAKYRKEKRSAIAEEREGDLLQAQQEAKKLHVTEFISANDLASLMGVSINEVLSTCMSLGMIISINQRLDAEAIAIIADEFGYQVEFTTVEDQTLQEEVEEDPSQLTERAPIVTIMGHVDHGKTSLLDCIRHTQITQGEAGGITQHIGAYSVLTERGKRIAFLDTPGHEAFTAMRARGAKLTDIAIIVVAADDGVRPQTKEAINHAQLAGVPIIIAINKIDKPEANPEKVKEELANLNILVEDWGGKYQSQGVSAKTGEGVSELLDKILLEAEMLELKANTHKQARGTVIEAALDQGRGYMATIMVQNGTLHVGDIVLAGAYYGKVKAMFDYLGKITKEASPSTPIQVLGLNGAPQAGDLFRVMSSEKEAREMATQRQQILREQGLRTKTHITLDEIGRRLAIGNFKELNIILKGDVDGSVEALSDSLLKLSTEEIKVNILHKGVGAIVESDILLAAASDAIVIGFQVRPSSNVRKLAEKEGIEIRLYSIIYDAINHIQAAIQGMLAPTVEEVITGSAVVREIFKVTGVGTIVGCYVTEGYIKKANPVRLIRDGIVTYTGTIKQLRRFKEEVPQIKSGFECGINISNFNDIKVDDIIEGFETKEVERKL